MKHENDNQILKDLFFTNVSFIHGPVGGNGVIKKIKNHVLYFLFKAYVSPLDRLSTLSMSLPHAVSGKKCCTPKSRNIFSII